MSCKRIEIGRVWRPCQVENKEKNGRFLSRRREVSGWSVRGFKSVNVAVRKGELFGLWDTRVAGLGRKEAESVAFVKVTRRHIQLNLSQETSAMELGHLPR